MHHDTRSFRSLVLNKLDRLCLQSVFSSAHPPAPANVQQVMQTIAVSQKKTQASVGAAETQHALNISSLEVLRCTRCVSAQVFAQFVVLRMKDSSSTLHGEAEGLVTRVYQQGKDQKRCQGDRSTN